MAVSVPQRQHGDRVVRRNQSLGPIVATYIYNDADGNPLYAQTRHEPKDFRRWRWDTLDNRWLRGGWGENGPPVLYHLDEIVGSNTNKFVHVAEGEKDADRLRSLGLLATNISGVKDHELTEVLEPLRGHPVVLYVDNDVEGARKRDKYVGYLRSISSALRVVEFPELPRGGDVSDWLDEGHDINDLKSLVSTCEVFTPQLPSTNGHKNGHVDHTIVIEQPPPEHIPDTPEFPLECLPAPLARIAEEGEAMGLHPADFVAVFGLAGLAVAAGGNWQVMMRSSWVERPILWTAVVSPTGKGKTPAVNAVFTPINEIAGSWYAEYNQAVNEWKKIPPNQRDAKPIRQMMVVQDITMERLGSILNENEHGVINVSDEVRSAVLQLNQYKGGKGSDRTKMLALWSGWPLDIARIKEDGNIHVARPTYCLTGGVQPSKLHELLASDDGMAGRFLMWYAPASPHRRLVEHQHGVAQDVIDEWRALIRRLILGTRPEQPTNIYLSPEANSEFTEAANEFSEIHNSDEGGYLGEVAAKMRSWLPRIALTLHVCKIALKQNPGDIIGMDTMMDAKRICDTFLAHSRAIPSHRPNLIATPQERMHDEAVSALVLWLQRHGRRATVREMIIGHVAGIRTADEARKLLTRYEATFPGYVETVGTQVVVMLP